MTAAAMTRPGPRPHDRREGSIRMAHVVALRLGESSAPRSGTAVPAPRRACAGRPTGGARADAVARPSATARKSAVARRRAVVVLVLLAACLALRWAAGGLGGAPLAASEPISAVTAGDASRGLTVVVQPGDTLWEVARLFQPEGDLRPLVDRLSAERDGRPLQVGERVRAP